MANDEEMMRAIGAQYDPGGRREELPIPSPLPEREPDISWEEFQSIFPKAKPHDYQEYIDELRKWPDPDQWMKENPDKDYNEEHKDLPQTTDPGGKERHDEVLKLMPPHLRQQIERQQKLFPQQDYLTTDELQSSWWKAWVEYLKAHPELVMPKRYGKPPLQKPWPENYQGF